MCRKNEVDCSFIKLVILLLPRDSIGRNFKFRFVHGEAFEVQHEKKKKKKDFRCGV